MNNPTQKSLRYKKIYIYVLSGIIFLSGYVAGGFSYRAGLHNKIPVVRSLVSFFHQQGTTSYAPNFRPALPQDTTPIFQKFDVSYPFTFIVYGDSREPAGYEKDLLISRIIYERPSFVLHTGDMVLFSEKHQWRIFDLLDGRIMEDDIPIYPALGNHEYAKRQNEHNKESSPLDLYFERFSYLRGRGWYSFIYGNSLFLILDTNTEYFYTSPQYKWLIDSLRSASSKFIFVAFHHPPYTKNIYKSNRRAERFLSDLFEDYKKKNFHKVDIVFSGHTHNYERYNYNGITYIVTGGGGAPPHQVERAPTDYYRRAGETYHYCKVTVRENSFEFQMVRLDKDKDRWVVDDSFVVQK